MDTRTGAIQARPRSDERSASPLRSSTWRLLAAVIVGVLPLAAPRAGFDSVSGDVVLDTIGATSTLFAAAVALAGYDESASRAREILTLAISLDAVSALLVPVCPDLLAIRVGPGLWIAHLTAAVVGAALLAWGAFAPAASPHRMAGRWQLVAVASVAAAAAIAAGDALASISPRASAGLHHVGAGSHTLERPAAVLVLAGTAAVLLALAAARFARPGAAQRIPCPPVLMMSALLGAWAYIDYMLDPRSSRSRVSLGDLLAAGSAVALVAWGTCELGRMRDEQRERAAERERERLARELHDGVAQELAFIVRQSRRLRGAFPALADLADISGAAQRALTDSRVTIHDLRESGPRRLAGTIEACAREMTDRSGLALGLDLEDELRVTAHDEHEVRAIVSEAISNAIRHAEATRVEVSLGRYGRFAVVRVSDDGRGLGRRAGVAATGIGLWSMRERAHGLGGRLRVHSVPGGGTTVELAFPCAPPPSMRRARGPGASTS